MVVGALASVSRIRAYYCKFVENPYCIISGSLCNDLYLALLDILMLLTHS